jgi:hypothetical protein
MFEQPFHKYRLSSQILYFSNKESIKKGDKAVCFTPFQVRKIIIVLF